MEADSGGGTMKKVTLTNNAKCTYYELIGKDKSWSSQKVWFDDPDAIPAFDSFTN